jgi:hypothetical protein
MIVIAVTSMWIKLLNLTVNDILSFTDCCMKPVLITAADLLVVIVQLRQMTVSRQLRY